nr:hypothetical protein [Klebsiella pneumoniae]
RYTVIDDQLYRRTFSWPHLKCVGEADGNNILKEVHEGVCGSHIGSRSLARKIMRPGYFWPTMESDAVHLVKTCRKCQIHANIHHNPSMHLTSLCNPVPFCQWGMDLLGPFPKAPGNKDFLVVAIDYFTKWVEAKPL